tara:strand:- start:296 stop:862 length:567 start_codon:yes stop_codon:yes gene_type:complete
MNALRVWDDGGIGIYFFVGLSYKGKITNDGTCHFYQFNTTSDDRIKTNETYIINAIDTLLKLSPQTYTKYISFDCSEYGTIESGLIAQDVHYNAPELRHIVSYPTDISVNDIQPIPDTFDRSDITIDPDYTSLGWGNTIASVNYTQLVPWLIKGIQEQQDIINIEKAKTAALESQMTDVLARLTSGGL